MSNFKVFVGDNNNQAKYVGQIPDDATIAKINNATSLPDQTGQAGKLLTTDGTDTSWSDTLSSLNLVTNTDGIKLTGSIMGLTVSTLGMLGKDIIDIENRGILPASGSNNIYLGGSSRKFKTVYTTKIANGTSDIEVPNTAGTMVVTDYTSATQGQVLQLDSNNNAVWSTISEVASQSSGTIKFWTGTQAQYDAITTKDATTLYIVIPAS